MCLSFTYPISLLIRPLNLQIIQDYAIRQQICHNTSPSSTINFDYESMRLSVQPIITQIYIDNRRLFNQLTNPIITQLSRFTVVFGKIRLKNDAQQRAFSYRFFVVVVVNVLQCVILLINFNFNSISGGFIECCILVVIIWTLQ